MKKILIVLLLGVSLVGCSTKKEGVDGKIKQFSEWAEDVDCSTEWDLNEKELKMVKDVLNSEEYKKFVQKNEMYCVNDIVVSKTELSYGTLYDIKFYLDKISKKTADEYSDDDRNELSEIFNNKFNSTWVNVIFETSY
ncbi:MAG: hypothetical protein ACI3T9_06880 [Romboutsia timonensis]